MALKTRWWVPWLYLVPALLLLMVFLAYPVVNTTILSLMNEDSTQFVGLDNYAYIFGGFGLSPSPPEGAGSLGDLVQATISAGRTPTAVNLIGPLYYWPPKPGEVLTAFRNNILWLIFFTAGTVGLGLVIAVLVDRVRYEAAAKALIFLPMAISFVAAGAIWKFMIGYKPYPPQISLVNAVLDAVNHLFGLASQGLVETVGRALPALRWPETFNGVAWLTNEPVNTFVLITVGIWMWTGFCLVVLSASLKSIPAEIIEAARIDGATEWQTFRHVMIPIMMPTIVVITTTMLITVLKVFDIVYVMTSGLNGTDVIANRMFKFFYVDNEYGRSAAVAVVLLLAIIPVMVYNIKQFRAQEALR